MFGPSRVARWTVRVIIMAVGFAAGMVLVLGVVDQADQVAPARDDLGVIDVRAIRAELLEQGGPGLWEDFMQELRAMHLGAPAPSRSVFAELRAAYEAVLTRKSAIA